MGSSLYYIILAVVTIVVIVLARKSNLLKDVPSSGVINDRTPFSLARTQLVFWTVVIFSSFLYLLLRHGFSVPELNNVNLILLGIAVSTTAAGKLIDDSQMMKAHRSQDEPSSGFLTDILSDKNGVSIHRLQNVLWTIIMGLIYVHYVATETALPDETVITDNLLLLMGISTGAYVGIKATENT